MGCDAIDCLKIETVEKTMLMKHKAGYYSRLFYGAGALSVATAFVLYGERLASSQAQQRLFVGRSCQTPADIYFQRHKFVPPPKTIHSVLSRKVSPKGAKGILVVGDVHGCLDELKLLHNVAIEANDNQPFEYVILVGDLVNKGPFSAQVIQFVRQQEHWLTVRGNHDYAALTAALSEEKPRQDSRYSWVNDLTNEDVQWLADLPYTIRIPASYWENREEATDVLIVHAGLVPGVELKDQTFDTMMTVRRVFPPSSFEQSLWATLWKGPEHVIFGHDAKTGLQQHEFATGLDTGCCYGKQITGILLPQRQLVTVKALREYSPIVAKET